MPNILISFVNEMSDYNNIFFTYNIKLILAL